MALEIPGWLPLAAAAERLGVDYESARVMVHEGVFTRGRFTSEKRGAPIYLRIEELDAWRVGGVDAVRRVQEAHKADAAKLPGHTPELGVAGQ